MTKKFDLQSLVGNESLDTEKIEFYESLREDPLSPEAYIISRKYGLDFGLMKNLILKYEHNKVLEFMDFYFNFTRGNLVNFEDSLNLAMKNGFSYYPKEISQLEQETMISENKYGINPIQRETELALKNSNSLTLKKRKRIRIDDLNYRPEVESSSHYSEHMFTKMLDREVSENEKEDSSEN